MKIANDVLNVLDAAEMSGSQLRLTGQLDRKLYVAVNKVLEAAGGKWSRSAKAHVFPSDAADLMDSIILTGEITTAQEMGYFPTPASIVERLCDLADIRPGMQVLEPSAGEGAIAKELVERGAIVDCVELDASRYARLERALPGCGLLGRRPGDFLAVEPAPIYDAVVMNPPFARQADIRHVLHALRFLLPGGALVSVMSAGVTFRNNRLTSEFRDLIDARGGSIEELPEGAFKESGTLVRTVIVKIPGARSLERAA